MILNMSNTQNMDYQTAVSELYKLQSKLSAYEHAVSLIYYDGSSQ